MLAVLLPLACWSVPVSTANGQLIIAHRGASYDAPENTLAAFRLAFAQGADGIEGDFHLTRDGQIVCIHDRDTSRVSKSKLVVAESTVAELKKLDVGRWKGRQWQGEAIPTLKEVIQVVPPDKHFFIELKGGPEIVPVLVRQLRDSKPNMKNWVVISFHADTIKACKASLPKLNCQWLTGYDKVRQAGELTGWSPSPEKILKTLRLCQADGIGSKANREAFNAKFIEQLARTGTRTFHVWTVDDVPTARFYQRLGAFGITTNRPKFIREGLEKQKRSGDR